MPSFTHLTNYAINKENADFRIKQEDITQGRSSKRTLGHVLERLRENVVEFYLLSLRIVFCFGAKRPAT